MVKEDAAREFVANGVHVDLGNLVLDGFPDGFGGVARLPLNSLHAGIAAALGEIPVGARAEGGGEFVPLGRLSAQRSS